MIIPIYDAVLLPGVQYISGLFYRLKKNMISEKENTELRQDSGIVVLVPLKERKTRKQICAEDFYPIGITAQIQKIKESEHELWLTLNTLQKVKVQSIQVADDTISADVQIIDDVRGFTKAERDELLGSIRETAGKVLGNVPGGRHMMDYLEKLDGLNKTIAFMSQFAPMTPEEKYRLSAADVLKDRGEAFHSYLKKCICKYSNLEQ